MKAEYAGSKATFEVTVPKEAVFEFKNLERKLHKGYNKIVCQ